MKSAPTHRRRLAAAFSICILGLFVRANHGAAATLAIENETLLAQFDDAALTFSVIEKASGRAFVAKGKLDGASAGAKVEQAQSPVFGPGKRIVARRADGGAVWLELYPGLTFLLLGGELHNGSLAPADINHVRVATLPLDLGKPAGQLRTMGTAGLTPPDQNPGSYLFLTLVEPATRRGVVAGWLTSDRGSGALFSEVGRDEVRFEARLDYGHLWLQAVESATLETLAIGVFDDARIGQELFAAAVARQYRIHLRPQAAGYCTWYSNPHGGAADEESIVELASFAVRQLKPYGFSFVQIDDKWQDGRERNGPARRFMRAKPDGPYPHGMKPVADRFRQLGLVPGIWFLPFASDCEDPEFKDRQDWFVKRADGRPFETPWGNTSLDLTRPEVQAYLTETVRTLHGWGFNYFKMDGLWTGTATEQIYVNDGYRDDHIGSNAPLHNPRKTNLEAFRDGLKLLREAAGPDVFFSGCNVSQNMRTLGGCLGLVDSMRIGPDNGNGWGDYRQEIARNGSGSIITGPVRGTRLYFLNGRVWWNDPDPTYVRASIPLSHARLITSWVALSGQFYLNSDWIPQLPPERLDLIKRTMPPHGGVARPVDYFDTVMPRIWLLTDTRQTERRDVLGLFNWESQDQAIACAAARAGLDPAKTFFAFDFWANAPARAFSSEFNYEVPAQSCRIIALRAAAGHPVLVSTSMHVSQGILEVSGEDWNVAANTLSGTSRVIGNDPYELRIAGLEDGGRKWKLASATVSAADKAAGVTIQPGPLAAGEEGWLRVRVNSAETRSIKWSLKFDVTPKPK
ncbi:MAG: glycoside hydrolase family 36 protein [Limisphaerales bacterium]